MFQDSLPVSCFRHSHDLAVSKSYAANKSQAHVYVGDVCLGAGYAICHMYDDSHRFCLSHLCVNQCMHACAQHMHLSL